MLTPLVRVTKPMMASPCIGLQHWAMRVSRSPTPSTDMPEVGLSRRASPFRVGIQAAAAASALRRCASRDARAESLNSPEPTAASRSSIFS